MNKKFFLAAALLFSGAAFAGEQLPALKAASTPGVISKTWGAVKATPGNLWGAVKATPGFVVSIPANAWNCVKATPAAVKAHPVKSAVIAAALVASYVAYKTYKDSCDEEETEETEDDVL